MSEETKFCKDCINAKPKHPDWETAIWYCGKHRLYITEHTCYSFIYDKDCKDYGRRS